jgi:RHS repeat-associated protein
MYDESGHILGEYDGSGNMIEETVWLGDMPVATIQPDPVSGVDVYYIHSDHLNAAKKVTRPSDNSLVWRIDQDPFGTAQPNQNPSGDGAFVYNLRFPGQLYMAETGLNYNYSRDYDPQTGRYVESDPLLQPVLDVAGGGLIFAVPYLFKRGGLLLPYAYAKDQPTGMSDPSGLNPVTWSWDLIKCMYYSSKYLDAAQNCRNRSGGCSQQQINFMAAYQSPSMSGAVLHCACLNAGPGVCQKMFESCGNTGNGAPKMTE